MLPEQLLNLLSGKGCTRGELAAAYGVDRAQVADWVAVLLGAGVAVEECEDSLALPADYCPLAAGAIRAALEPEVGDWLRDISISTCIGSTNSLALGVQEPYPALFLAEMQTAGRGRRGRRWAGVAGNLFFSLAWRPEGSSASLMGLSLVVGVAIARALERCGTARIGLKWPNDLVCEDGKLGGVLIETDGAGRWVIGIGINVVAVPEGLDYPAVALAHISQDPVDRNVLVTAMLNALAPLLQHRHHWPAALDEWRLRDCYRDQQVALYADGTEMAAGTACGINARGELLVQTSDGLRAFASGELSLRHQSD